MIDLPELNTNEKLDDDVDEYGESKKGPENSPEDRPEQAVIHPLPSHT